REEEESFVRTLDRGIARYTQISAKQARESGTNKISGAEAFCLHDTYGLYIDIVEQMAQESGLTVDRECFDKFMAEAKEKARVSRKKLAITAVIGDLPKTDDSLKYRGLTGEGKVLGWVRDNAVVRSGK